MGNYTLMEKLCRGKARTLCAPRKNRRRLMMKVWREKKAKKEFLNQEEKHQARAEQKRLKQLGENAPSSSAQFQQLTAHLQNQRPSSSSSSGVQYGKTDQPFITAIKEEIDIDSKEYTTIPNLDLLTTELSSALNNNKNAVQRNQPNLQMDTEDNSENRIIHSTESEDRREENNIEATPLEHSKKPACRDPDPTRTFNQQTLDCELLRKNVSLCVLCGKDISRLRSKKSVCKFLDLILTVTSVDVTEYPIEPDCCGVCYKSMATIKSFKKTVTQANFLIYEKLFKYSENLKEENQQAKTTTASVKTKDQAAVKNTQHLQYIRTRNIADILEVQNISSNDQVEQHIGTKNIADILEVQNISSNDQVKQHIGTRNIADILEVQNISFNNQMETTTIKAELETIEEADGRLEDGSILVEDGQYNQPIETVQARNINSNNKENTKSSSDHISLDSGSPAETTNSVEPNNSNFLPTLIVRNFDKIRAKLACSITNPVENQESTTAFDKNLLVECLEINKSGHTIIERTNSDYESSSRQDNTETIEKPKIGTKILCYICKKVFSGEEFKNHAHVVRKRTPVKNPIRNSKNCLPTKLKCNVCGKLYSRDNRRHCLIHKFIKCITCGKSISHSNMKRHRQSHEPETKENIICALCGKMFRSNASFKRHEVTHGDKKHVCEVCGNSFHFLKYLQRHMRSHSGEKPYACSYCDKTFSILWNLHQHERLHTNSKPYKCPLCPAEYRHNVVLKNHLAMSHPASEIAASKQNEMNTLSSTVVENTTPEENHSNSDGDNSNNCPAVEEGN